MLVVAHFCGIVMAFSCFLMQYFKAWEEKIPPELVLPKKKDYTGFFIKAVLWELIVIDTLIVRVMTKIAERKYERMYYSSGSRLQLCEGKIVIYRDLKGDIERVVCDSCDFELKRGQQDCLTAEQMTKVLQTKARQHTCETETWKRFKHSIWHKLATRSE